jgi:uncharacterized repeat protein (TIGR01451 family)
MEGRTIIQLGPSSLCSPTEVAPSCVGQSDPIPVNPPIPSGIYDVTLESFDEHSIKPGQIQLNESYFLRLLDDSDDKIVDTNAISDLPDNQDILTQKVNTNLFVRDYIDSIIAIHFCDDSTENLCDQSPNSIQPVCVAFDLPEPAIDIRKQEEGDDTRTFPPGSDVEFEIVVTNTGDVDLSNVVVTDFLVDDCDYDIGSLAPGEAFTYTCTAYDVTMSFVNEACVAGEHEGVTVEDCDPSTVEIEGGGQGCTPGYWKQGHHFDSWTSPYTPKTLFSDVFEDAFPGKTLLEVLGQGGGHLIALGRHTVAALLNAASPDVSYDLAVQEVIDMFNAKFPGGDYEELKDWFEDFNEQGCPLNGGKKGKGKDDQGKKGKGK